MSLDTLQDLFVYKLRQQYYIERTLLETLEEMAEGTTNGRMRQTFLDHHEKTRAQIERLEDVFETIGVSAASENAPVVDALEEERRSYEQRIDDDDMLDTVYLNTGLMIERIEMTAYEELSLLATELELPEEARRPLESNHDEEQSTYEELHTLAAAAEMKSLWDRLTPS